VSEMTKLIQMLFWSTKPVDYYPEIHGKMSIPHPAKRNRSGKAEVSKTVAKAVLAALKGMIIHAGLGRTPDGDATVSVLSPGRGGETRETVIVYDADWRIRSAWVADGLDYRATYHIPLCAMTEALVRPDAARDLLEAYEHLLRYYESLGKISLDALRGDATFADLVLTASDELYYWLRYGDADPAPENDRVGDQVFIGFASEIENHVDADLPFTALTDADALTGVSQGTTSAPVASQGPWPDVQGTFIGAQLGQIVHALQRGRNVLAVGPTGSGKTHAISEALACLKVGYEMAKGAEGMIDLDLLGAIVPKEGGDRVWVDGPLARAFRRAAAGPAVVWIDEATRVPTRHMNLLIGVMNPESLNDLALRAILPDGISPSGMYYTLEIPGTGEMLSCPVENLVFVLSANLGRQYAVHKFDPALERRCDYQIDFGYLDEDTERTLIARRIGQPAMAVIPTVVSRVAARVREQHANAQLSGTLDTGSAVIWAQEAKEMVPRTDVETALIETAMITWIPRAAGRDHTGQVDQGKALGLQDVIRDAVANTGGAV